MSSFKNYFRSIWKNFLYILPHKTAHTILYNRYHKGHKINMKKPLTYDEKIHWLIANYYDEYFAKYADKILVRDYVKECGLEDILIPLVGKGVYRDPEEIDYSELPPKFVIKTNHGSGPEYYQICTDKNQLDKKLINEKFSKALKQDMGRKFCEYHYRGITPRILCEELLEDGVNSRITDYKTVCSYGEVKAILVCSDRDEGRDYFDVNWNYLPYVKEEYRYGTEIQKPQALKDMIKAAEILSKPFPLARVDFYAIGDKLFFGEITLTPSSGNHQNLNDEGQLKLGDAIKLPVI